MLKVLGDHGINRLLVEGGAALTEALLTDRLVDRFHLLTSPQGHRPRGSAGHWSAGSIEDGIAACRAGARLTSARWATITSALSKGREHVFTGIVTDVGRLLAADDRNDGRLLRIATSYEPEAIDLGASITVDGICLTVTDKGRARHQLVRSLRRARNPRPSPMSANGRPAAASISSARSRSATSSAATSSPATSTAWRRSSART